MRLHLNSHLWRQALRIQRHLQQRARGIARVQHDQRIALGVGQFRQAHRPGGGPAAQVHQLGMAQAHARQAGVVVGVEGNGQVQFARQQTLHQFRAVMRVDVEGDAGLRIAAFAHHVGQQAQPQCGRAAQPQMPVRPVAQAGDQPAHAVQVLVQARDFGCQDFGLARGNQATLHALKQLEAELGFGVRQQFAGGGLRDMQRGGGLGQGSGTADRFENLDVAQAHVRAGKRDRNRDSMSG
ncbi:hypothetical protein D3C87_1401560 [compost metagenome]